MYVEYRSALNVNEYVCAFCRLPEDCYFIPAASNTLSDFATFKAVREAAKKFIRTFFQLKIRLFFFLSSPAFA